MGNIQLMQLLVVNGGQNKVREPHLAMNEQAVKGKQSA